MRAKKGGYAVQRRYRIEGRDRPTELATQVHRNNARMRQESSAEGWRAYHPVPATGSPYEPAKRALAEQTHAL
jgi:hypothetical protein